MIIVARKLLKICISSQYNAITSGKNIEAQTAKTIIEIILKMDFKCSMFNPKRAFRRERLTLCLK